MATLEKFFCLFALLIASLMSLLLCAVLSTVPARHFEARPMADGMLAPPPVLSPRAPGASGQAPIPDGQ
jgi:hypothetical protein